MAISDLRPLAILAGYLLLCLSLTALILRSLPLRRGHRLLPIFAILAVASLCTTWYYMIRFFQHSYISWGSAQSPSSGAVTLGSINLWLSDVPLFRVAWETVVNSPTRWFWSQQIFLATVGWSMLLAHEGRARNVPHLWAYMLLGQVVAISFAMNLFFIAMLLHPRSPSAVAAAVRDGKWQLLSALVAASYAFIYSTPEMVGTKRFLQVVLVPHGLLLLPCVFGGMAGGGKLPYAINGIASIVFRAKVLYQVGVDATLPGRLWRELNAHPAVSSVGWDVIMVITSVVVWEGARKGWWRMVGLACAMLLAGAGLDIVAFVTH